MELVDAAFDQVDKMSSALPQTSGSFTVNKDNVLAAAKIIGTQADALQDKLTDAAYDLRIDPPGTDEVSIRVAAAWNDRLVGDDDSYKWRVQEYVNSLHKLVQQLSDTAKAYGYTEEDIAKAFGDRSA